MLPTMQIGDLAVTRLIVGTNPFTGKSHLSDAMNAEMKEYYSEQAIFDTLRRCEMAGINAVQSRGSQPMMGVIYRYRRAGGNLLYLCQTGKNEVTFDEELEELLKYKPNAVCIHGELADALYMTGRIRLLGGFLDKLKRTGLPAGICAHFPEVLAYAEENGLKPDYYMASVYNILQPDRSHDVNPTGERFEDSDLPKMYSVIRSLSAPCVALKILGAGRKCATQDEVRATFKSAFANIKPTDGVLVGMFDKHENQPFLDAQYTREAIAGEK